MSRKRKAHGAAAKGGATIVFEAVASDEVRRVSPDAAAPVERRTDGSVTRAGASELARMRWEAARLPNFAERELEYVPAAAFAPFDRARVELTAGRRQEIHVTAGGVSRALGSMIRGWAWMVSFAEYWASVAAQTGDAEAFERARKLIQAASIEDAKVRDAAAWEAAVRVEAEGDNLAKRQRDFQRQLAERQREAATSREAEPARPSTTIDPSGSENASGRQP